MTDSNEVTISFKMRPIQCPHCGTYCAPDTATCQKCGGTLVLDLVKQPIATIPIERTPRSIASTEAGQVEFPADYQLVLQILPSGVCLQFVLEKPMTLGRAASPTHAEDLIDLQTFNANQHGISRRHCTLSHLENRLYVTDLNSTNGTYLNGKRLIPQEAHIVSHGDRLVLGTLNMTVFFSSVKGEEPPPG